METGTRCSDPGRAGARHARNPGAAPTRPSLHRRKNQWPLIRDTKWEGGTGSRHEDMAGSPCWGPVSSMRQRAGGAASSADSCPTHRADSPRATNHRSSRQDTSMVRGWPLPVSLLGHSQHPPSLPQHRRTDGLSPAPGSFSLSILSSVSADVSCSFGL